jgi:hypothetical protein
VARLFVLRERGWLQPDVENFIWKQLRHAFGAEVRLFDGSDTLMPALNNEPGTRVFLFPEATHAGETLDGFMHPPDAVYIFGNAFDSLRSLRRATDPAVTVYTAKQVDVFACNIAAIVLHDRMRKSP